MEIVELLNNEYFVFWSMAVIVFICTQILKTPIKLCTKHIKNERVRRMVNATILLIPFAVGVALDLAYTTYISHEAFNVLTGLGYGTAGVSVYGMVERFFKVKTANPYETTEGEAVLELVNEVKKNNGKEKTAVAEFFEKVGK